MKTVLLSVTFTVMCVFYAAAQVGIGTTAPNSSSLLDVSSTNKGILVPRLTAAQKTAISSPATGLLIFQTDGTPGLYYNVGTPSSPSWTYTGTTTGQWLLNGSNIYYDNGYVGIGTTNPSRLLTLKNSAAAASDYTAFYNNSDYLVFRIRQGTTLNPALYLYDGLGSTGDHCNVFFSSDGSVLHSYIKNGRLGIGTTAPGSGLHIYGDAFPESFLYLEGATGNDAGIRFYEAGTVKWHLYNSTTTNGFNLVNNAFNIVLFASQTNGYIGLGTTAPKTLLDVQGHISVNNSGRIGIGTTAPTHPLDVVGNVYITGNLGIGATTANAGLHVKGNSFPGSFIFIEGAANIDAGIRFYESSTAKWHMFHNTTANGLHLYNADVETAIFARDDNGYVGIGHTAPERPLDVKGNMVVRNASTNDIVVELGVGLDYAEGFNIAAEEAPEPGTVMSIDPHFPGMLMVCREAYDHKVAGIVAGANSLGSGVVLGSGGHQVNVALAGRVYCKVDASTEGIEIGDLLTTSDNPGYAKRAGPGQGAAGAILGKAMESLPKGTKGQILVLVTLQ